MNQPARLRERPHYLTRTAIFQYVSLILLIAGTIFAIPLEQKAAGYALLGLGSASLLLAGQAFARHIGLIFLSIAIIGLAPINTSIDLPHVVQMGGLLSLAILVPFLVTRYIYKEDIIRFPLGSHTWTKGHVGYLLLALVLSYLLLPLWMASTGEYRHWTVETDPLYLFILFLGTNGLGIWDELFFIITALALLRRHLPFHGANFVQACLFTAFLYELGFRGWAPLAVFPFALLQGLVFRKTENLVYIVAIHLTVDLVLYLALINAHHPHLLDIFITNLK